MPRKNAEGTLWLAWRALENGAIDRPEFDFIESSPERAHELTEFVEWVHGHNPDKEEEAV